jgi:dTMP kinase
MVLKDYPGFFITLEGIEGVGKTTNMRFLAEYLHQENIPVLVTREPGGTPLADDIRHFLLSEHDEAVLPETELLLLFAARAQHINNVITPALAAGKIVICDRFTDTSYAYQGAGRGIATEKIAMLESVVQEGLKPDLTILFDAPIEVGLSRIKAREKTDRFESETKNFFYKCRQGYLALAEAEPERFVVINADQAPEELQQKLIQILQVAIDKINKK